MVSLNEVHSREAPDAEEPTRGADYRAYDFLVCAPGFGCLPSGSPRGTPAMAISVDSGMWMNSSRTRHSAFQINKPF